MPVTSKESDNFINALSDFWPAFFRDTASLRAAYRGVHISVSQLYLELLETVLGTSLRHMPVFSKRYLYPATLSESSMAFVEGASLDDDRYVITLDEPVVSVQALMNRLVNPTATLETPRDFAVENGRLYLVNNPFDVDGTGTTLPLFPLRTVKRVFPCEFYDNFRRDFASLGVRPGDILRYKPVYGPETRAVVSMCEGSRLLLTSAPPELVSSTGRRPYDLQVLRTPFDGEKSGETLSDHPLDSVEIGTGGLVVVAGTKNVDFTLDANYQGAWVSATPYTAGQLVSQGGSLYSAKVDTAAVVFTVSEWQLVDDTYIFVYDTVLTNSGLFKATLSVGPIVTLDRPSNFTASALTVGAFMAPYASATGDRPSAAVANSYIEPGTFRVQARRAHAIDAVVNGVPTTFPAAGAVVEGVDYSLDYETGALIYLSIWDPRIRGRTSYVWKKAIVVDTFAHLNMGAWAPATSYARGDLVTYGGTTFVSQLAHVSAGTFSSTLFKEYLPPFLKDLEHSVREIGTWGVDAYVDRDQLYKNFGSILGFKKPSSEAYRAFLQGVAQLFVLGPALERFESALNTTAGLPVIRDDEETLISYTDGIDASGATGSVLDEQDGTDGVLNTGASSFTSATAVFFPSDLGSRILVENRGVLDSYVITSVTSSTSVNVFPAPPASGTGAIWSHAHPVLSRHFRSNGAYAFVPSDVGGYVWITSSVHERNTGLFRVTEVLNADTVVLDSAHGLRDESGLTWAFSRRKTQQVTTDRRTYEFDLLVPVKARIKDPSNFYALTLKAFQPMTDAFVVTDYVQSPSWWQRVLIPKEVVSQELDLASRRQVAPDLIEHRLNPVDDAYIGDPGLGIGLTDDNASGIAREGTALWMGSTQLVLTFATGMPVASNRDVGSYLVVGHEGVESQFKIVGVNPAGTTVSLERFPPSDLAVKVPPVSVDVRLPELLFRRNVAFVLMNKLLKQHAIYVSIDKSVQLDGEFYADISRILKEARPSHAFVYLATGYDLEERVGVAETFSATIV